MPKVIDLTGLRFGKLLVISRAENKGGLIYFNCQCDCGKSCTTSSHNLRGGDSKSCGCMKYKGMLKHGRSQSGAYRGYKTMMARCYDPRHKNYERYHGNGIGVCPEWRESVEKFMDDMGPRPKGFTLDRRSNKLGYSKENCKWSSRLEQSRNRDNTVIVDYNGEALTLSEWAVRLNIAYDVLYMRLIKYKWTIEKAFSTITGKMGGSRKHRPKNEKNTIPSPDCHKHIWSNKKSYYRG